MNLTDRASGKNDIVCELAGERKNEHRIHLGLFLALLICIPAFVFETMRALDGNMLSWAYVFEWPLLAGYSVYMWRKMLKEERGETPRRNVPDHEPDDPQLVAWNAYLANVHKDDQPAAPERRVD